MDNCRLFVRSFVVFVLTGRFLDLQLNRKAIGISLPSFQVPILIVVYFHSDFASGFFRSVQQRKELVGSVFHVVVVLVVRFFHLYWIEGRSRSVIILLASKTEIIFLIGDLRKKNLTRCQIFSSKNTLVRNHEKWFSI